VETTRRARAAATGSPGEAGGGRHQVKPTTARRGKSGREARQRAQGRRPAGRQFVGYGKKQLSSSSFIIQMQKVLHELRMMMRTILGYFFVPFLMVNSLFHVVNKHFHHMKIIFMW
jgi:hypothetical protein